MWLQSLHSDASCVQLVSSKPEVEALGHQGAAVVGDFNCCRSARTHASARTFLRHSNCHLTLAGRWIQLEIIISYDYYYVVDRRICELFSGDNDVQDVDENFSKIYLSKETFLSCKHCDTIPDPYGPCTQMIDHRERGNIYRSTSEPTKYPLIKSTNGRFLF